METSNLRMFLCPFCREVYKYLNTYVRLCKPAFKGTVSRDFLLLVFFMNQFFLSPTVFQKDRFHFFSKIRGDIFKSRCTTGIFDNGSPKKISTSIACVVDTGGKFATGVNDIGGKFATSVNGSGGNLPLISTTPAANLPPV
jgi:hypothetical protein